MPPKSNVPIRICGSKTRSGCKTCKQRHVKCDERKPICSRCQKSRRTCLYEFPQVLAARSPSCMGDGPPLTIEWHHQNYLSPPGWSGGISPYGPRPLPEISAIAHFAIHLGKELAGAFTDRVWSCALPLVAQHEPSIWYAMTAVGMLDASQRSGGAAERNAAIKQYGKAMQQLNMRIRSREDKRFQDVVLLSCLLLAIFECLQANIKSALRHIGCGVKLLIEWENEAVLRPHETTGVYLSRRCLLPVFLALESQAIQLGAVEFRKHSVMPVASAQLDESAQFIMIEEAHLSLSHIFNQMSHWAVWMESCVPSGEKPSREWMETEKQRLAVQFARWDSAFTPLSQRPNPVPATFVLSAQRRVMQAFFRKLSDGPFNEMEWDNHTELFRGAVEDAETYMSFVAGSSPSCALSVTDEPGRLQPPRSIFTIAMDLVLALFLVSTRCRNAKLRRRALTMMRAYNRREGMWDSNICSLISGKIVDLEESAALEDGFVPESARIYDIDVQLTDERNGIVTFKRRIRDELDGHCFEVQEKFIA